MSLNSSSHQPGGQLSPIFPFLPCVEPTHKILSIALLMQLFIFYLLFFLQDFQPYYVCFIYNVGSLQLYLKSLLIEKSTSIKFPKQSLSPIFRYQKILFENPNHRVIFLILIYYFPFPKLFSIPGTSQKSYVKNTSEYDASRSEE